MKLQEGKTNPLIIFLFSLMVIYYVMAIIYSYKSYHHLKALFMQQYGDVYQMQGGHHNDEEEARYQAQ